MQKLDLTMCQKCKSRNTFLAKDGETYHSDKQLMRVRCFDCKCDTVVEMKKFVKD